MIDSTRELEITRQLLIEKTVNLLLVYISFIFAGLVIYFLSDESYRAAHKVSFFFWVFIPIFLGVVFGIKTVKQLVLLIRAKERSYLSHARKVNSPGIDESLIHDYKRFYDTAYSYIGSYPLWKVQQEFRQLILSLEPSKDFKGCDYHFHNLDNYLSKIIEEMASLDSIRPVGSPHWENKEMLSGAKGDYLLDEIKKKHPEFKNYEERKNENRRQEND